MRRLLLLGLMVVAGCKDAETAAQQDRQGTAQEMVNKGRAAMASSDFDTALRSFKRATELAPADPMLFVLLAQAQREAGLEGAAVLSLKQAEDLGSRADPAVKRERAELYRRMGQTVAAIATLTEMREAAMLTDVELLMLARMQARAGDLEGAIVSLERVQKRNPDDAEAKIVEAEILLDKGEELYAANIMDRLLNENPAFTNARLLRARYFLTNGEPRLADQDLDAIGPEAQKETEVVTMRARVLNALERYDDAAKLLQPLVDENPKDADLAAQLAETRLLLGEGEEAQALIDMALSLRNDFPRALYVRGRAMEVQGNEKAAVEDYKAALKQDGRLGPALSRLWPIYKKRDDKPEAISALERLVLLQEATPDEKIALAEMYAETGLNPDKARKIVDDLLKKTPDDEKLKALKKKLGKPKPKNSGVVIIKRGRGR